MQNLKQPISVIRLKNIHLEDKPMSKRFFLSPPHMGGQELEYVHKVFESNYIAPLGEYVNRFEDSIKTYTGAGHALALNSGTGAIHLALRILGVEPGDFVLASSMTFIGSVSPITFQHAQPIFVDSELDSWNLDPALLEEAIKKAPKKPKALILTHLYGQPAKLEEIIQICSKHGIVLIEDAAESLGASYKGKQTGTFGAFGIYSFNGNKIITTSGGGMLISENGTYIEHARKLSTQAREPEAHYEHTEIGFNYRLSNVLAAIGVGQMEVLEERVKKKRQIFDWYREALSDVDDIKMMPELEGCEGNRWLTCLTLEKSSCEKIRLALEKENFESRPLWKPMHLQPVFKMALSVVNGNSEVLFQKGLCLPSGTEMEINHIEQVAAIIKRNLA